MNKNLYLACLIAFLYYQGAEATPVTSSSGANDPLVTCLLDSDNDGVISIGKEDEMFLSSASFCEANGGARAENSPDIFTSFVHKAGGTEALVDSLLDALQNADSEDKGRPLKQSSASSNHVAVFSTPASTPASLASPVYTTPWATLSPQPHVSSSPVVYTNHGGVVSFPQKVSQKGIPAGLERKLRNAGKKIPPYDHEEPWVCRHIAGYMERMIPELTYTVFTCIDLTTLPWLPIPVVSRTSLERAAEAYNDHARNGRFEEAADNKFNIVSHAINDFHNNDGIIFIEPQAFMQDAPSCAIEDLDLNGDGIIREKEAKRLSATRIRICWIKSYDSHKAWTESLSEDHPSKKDSCIPKKKK